MCTYYYLHYHHIPPCDRPIEYQVHYNYCVAAIASLGTAVLTTEQQDTATSNGDNFATPRNPLGSPQLAYSRSQSSDVRNINQNYFQYHSSVPITTTSSEQCNIAMSGVQLENIIPCPDALPDTTFPSGCGPGSPACLEALPCASGSCRLTDLGGRWRCCVCGRGGNKYIWCANRNKEARDTFCYHRICGTCHNDRK